jgi:RNA polymerase sigma-70 factor (ECF subfamily)
LDEPAFVAAYERTGPRLRAYLRRISGDGSLADDILQEAFIRLLRSGRPDAAENETRAFLYRTATHLVYDHWRHRKREQKALGRLELPSAAPPAGLLGADLGRVFARLAPRQRALLWLAHVEGWSHAEIGRALGLHALSVRVMLFRARAELARRLRRAGLQPRECLDVSS